MWVYRVFSFAPKGKVLQGKGHIPFLAKEEEANKSDR